MGVPGPDYHQLKKLNFRDYVHAYDLKGETNINMPRSVGAISLYLSRNTQGG